MRRSTVWAVAVGLALRLGWMLTTARAPHLDHVADPGLYERMAQQSFGHDALWPYGHGGPTTFLSIGYPGVLRAISLGTGGLLTPFAAAMLLNLIAGGVIIAGVAAVVSCFDVRAAVVAAWLTACWPDLITASGQIMTELPAAALLVVAVAELTSSRDGWHRRAAWTLPALAAAFVWLRPSLQLVAMVIVIAVWRRGGAALAARTAAVIAILLLPLGLWSMVRVDAGLGLTSAQWINICDGTSSSAFRADPQCRPRDDEVWTERGWVERSKSVAITRIKSDPVGWVSAAPAKLWETVGHAGWGTEVGRNWSGHLPNTSFVRLVESLATWCWRVALALGLAGLWVRRHDKSVRLLAILTIAATVAVLITFGTPRFQLPMLVLLVIPCSAERIAKGAAWVHQRGSADGRSMVPRRR